MSGYRKVARSRSLILLCVHPRSFACRSSPLHSLPCGARRVGARLHFTTGSSRLATAQQTARRTPPSWSNLPRFPTHSSTCAVAHSIVHHPGSTHRVSWCLQYRSFYLSSTCGGRASNASQSFAYRDFRGAFAGRPSATHARASSGCLIAPHLDGSNILSWRLRRRPFSQAGMCGVLLRTPPTPRTSESA